MRIGNAIFVATFVAGFAVTEAVMIDNPDAVRPIREYALARAHGRQTGRRRDAEQGEKPLTSPNVICAARSMAVAGKQFNSAVVVPTLKNLTGSEEWEKVAEESHPVPLALFYHLHTIVEILESCAELCESDRTHAVTILSRSILESSKWAQWIVYPQDDIEKCVRRARSCLVRRREVLQWVRDESHVQSGNRRGLEPKSKTKIDEAVKNSVGGVDDAYGVMSFPCMLKSMGQKEDYALYRVTSYISHGAAMIERGDASIILCGGVALECYQVALVTWEMLGVHFQAFAKHFHEPGQMVLKERARIMEEQGMDPYSGLSPDWAKGMKEILGG